jgi:hypothetical protein
MSISLFLVLIAASLIARTYADVRTIKDNLARLPDAITLVKELPAEEVCPSSPFARETESAFSDTDSIY